MKYFTPELYVQGNSADPEAVDRTEEEWERRLKRYHRHYKQIEPHLPESVRKFHDHLNLHDADVLGPAYVSAPNIPWGLPDGVIVVQNENTLVPEHLHTLMFLRYTLTAEPVIAIPVPSDVFHEIQPIWLYDEIDLVEPGVYAHEILLSNGRVLRLQFREFQLHVAKLVAPNKTLNLKHASPDRAASA